MAHDHQSSARRRRVARRLYRLFIAGALLGAALPVLTIVMSAGDGESAWLPTLRGHTFYPEELAYRAVRAVFDAFPALDELSWHRHPVAPSSVDYYVHYARFNLLLLLAAVLWRSRFLRLLEAVAAWLERPDHRRERRIIVVAAAAMIFAFQTKTFYGFYWPGISGWTMHNFRPEIADRPPPASDQRGLVHVAEHPYLMAAVVHENARYLPRAGYLTKPAMFLHFDNGEVLPGNHELAEIVFPHKAFGSYWGELSEPWVFVRIVQASLENRRQGRRFLLPIAVSYPNHSPYMFIDYRDYPAADTLARISFWRLTLRVHERGEDGRRRVEIAQAAMERSFDVP